MSELIIDDNNFSDYFFDVRTNKPQPGQIMACFSAMAEFAPSIEKMHVILLLRDTDKVFAATQVMQKLHHASKLDAIRIPRQIVEDLLAGMTPEQINDKIYNFNMQMYFYTKKEYLPKDNPHWSTISILNISDKIKIEIGNNN